MLSTNSKLPANFQFSQSSLQDFVDCQRRFQLRYIQRLVWPAVKAEPALENELYLQRGAQFHQIAHQHLLGIPAEKLDRMAAEDQKLSQWWRNFIDNGPDLSDYAQHPETTLSAPMGDDRLVAKYDLIAIKSPQAVIYDWKTARKRPKRKWLVDKLQTRVYAYLLVRAGAQLNAGQPIEADEVEMVYWFSEFPDQPARFPYSAEQFAKDEAYLSGLIAETKNLGDEDAPRTDDEWRCKYCLYRSLCNRGKQAGPLDEMDLFGEAEEAFEIELDFEQISEIEY
ncbi:MAG: PD-(D/E)XK nuclease family protein [Chloroflexota bacterium]|nr:PD-(D/E)XK nuclease family protein [Chloroflexota bacterium]